MIVEYRAATRSSTSTAIRTGSDEILRDTSKLVEFDRRLSTTMMTPSARYADMSPAGHARTRKSDDVHGLRRLQRRLRRHPAASQGGRHPQWEQTPNHGSHDAASRSASRQAKRPLPKERPSSSGSNGATTKLARPPSIPIRSSSRTSTTFWKTGLRCTVPRCFPTRASRSRRSARTRKGQSSQNSVGQDRDLLRAPCEHRRRTGCFPKGDGQ